MPRQCSVCTHPQRPAIDAALVAGESLRSIAKQFTVSDSALFRHRDHIPAALADAHDAQEVAQADDLLSQIRDLQRRTLTMLTTAEKAGELPTALKAVREARSNLELLAKLQGQLQEGTTVNVLVSPEWVNVRTRIMVALQPYLEARLAVADALADEGDGA